MILRLIMGPPGLKACTRLLERKDWTLGTFVAQPLTRRRQRATLGREPGKLSSNTFFPTAASRLVSSVPNSPHGDQTCWEVWDTYNLAGENAEIMEYLQLSRPLDLIQRDSSLDLCLRSLDTNTDYFPPPLCSTGFRYLVQL